MLLSGVTMPSYEHVSGIQKFISGNVVQNFLYPATQTITAGILLPSSIPNHKMNKFKNELILMRGTARRIFEVAYSKRPNEPETAILHQRWSVLDEVLQVLERIEREHNHD